MIIKYRSNLACGIASVLAAVILCLIIPQQIGLEATVKFGITSRTIPYGIAAVFALCGVGLIVQSLVLKKDKVKELDLKAEVPALLMFAVLLVYLLLFEKEWPLSTAAVGCAALVLSKSKKWYYYAIVVALTIALYFIFVNMLHIRLNSFIFGLVGL